jgi:hypothetical protein
MSKPDWPRALAAAALCGLCMAASGGAYALPFNVLWWDSTPEYGGQAPNARRQAMSDSLTSFNGGAVFNSTYVGSETPGTLATQLASNSYDVIVFDATTGSPRFSAADIAAIQAHYQNNNRNLLFDGTLYIRNINYNATTNYPGPNGGMQSLTVNEVFALASRGGGIMVGTDHNCCQTDANQVVAAILPLASFSGSTTPSTDGVFHGTQMLASPSPVAPLDIFTHWDSVPTEGIPPTGTFTDFLGANVTLYSQVDVADDPGGGPRFAYISTSFQPGQGDVIITDPDPPQPPGPGAVPEPATLAVVGLGLIALVGVRRRRR